MKTNKPRQQVLADLAGEVFPDQPIPAREIKEKVESSIQLKANTRRRQRQAISLSTLAFLLLAGAIFLMTPSGKAAAESLFQFFRNEPASQRPPQVVVQRETELPTWAPAQNQPSETSTLEPQIIVLDDFISDLTVEEAEKLAGFAVTGTQQMPEGYLHYGVAYNQRTQGVIQTFTWDGKPGGEIIFLSQQLSAEVEPVGQDAEIQAIKLGETRVEVVAGCWFQLPGSSMETWEADAPVYTYRWLKDGFHYSLMFVINEPSGPGYLSEENRLTLVKLLTGNAEEVPEYWNLNNLSLEDAREVTDFSAIVPTREFPGLSFDRAVYEPENRRLVFLYEPDGSPFSLRIFEIPLPGQTETDYSNYPPDSVEEVMVGGYPATLVRGAMVDGKYDPNFSISLSWKTETVFINLFLRAMGESLPDVPVDVLVNFAEGMK